MIFFTVWIPLIPLEQKSNLNHIKKVYKNEDFYNVIMFSEDTKIL